MSTSSQYPPDQELLDAYLAHVTPPDNQPVGIWIDEKYWPPLWVLAKSKLRSDGHRAEDALHDTAERMCRWTVAERPAKFTPVVELVIPALRNRVKDACKTITGRKSYQTENNQAPETLPSLSTSEEGLREILETERRVEILEQYAANRWGAEEAEVVRLIFRYQYQARSEIRKRFGWSEDKIHKIITKIKRHFRMLKLRDDESHLTS